MPPSIYDVSPSDAIFRDLGIIPTFPGGGGPMPGPINRPMPSPESIISRDGGQINLPGPIDTAPINMPDMPPISYMGTPPVGGNTSGAATLPQSQAPENPSRNALRQPTRTRPPEVPTTGIAQPRNPAPKPPQPTQWVMGPSGREAEWEKVPDTRQNFGPTANRSRGGRMATPSDPWIKNPQNNYQTMMNKRRNALTPGDSPMFAANKTIAKQFGRGGSISPTFGRG